MLASKLREEKSELWLRIHSLPESKRYAENEQEAGILARHNEIAAKVLGLDSGIFLYSH